MGQQGKGRLCLVLPGGPPAPPMPELFLCVLCSGVMLSPPPRVCVAAVTLQVYDYLATVENASTLFLNSQHILHAVLEPVRSEFWLIGFPSPSLYPTVTLQATAQISRSRKHDEAPGHSPVLLLSHPHQKRSEPHL